MRLRAARGNPHLQAFSRLARVVPRIVFRLAAHIFSKRVHVQDTRSPSPSLTPRQDASAKAKYAMKKARDSPFTPEVRVSACPASSRNVPVAALHLCLSGVQCDVACL